MNRKGRGAQQNCRRGIEEVRKKQLICETREMHLEGRKSELSRNNNRSGEDQDGRKQSGGSIKLAYT